MISLFSTVNWIGILLAFVAYCILGGLWFTVLFKKPYATSLGKNSDELHNTSPVFIAGPAICSLVITLTTAILLRALGIDTYGKGIEFALVTGIGYLVANTVNIAINPNMPRPFLYSAISGAFHLTGLLIATTILVAMG